MTDVLAPPGRRPTGEASPVPPNPAGLAVRRRWGRLALGAGLVVLWVWGTVAVVIASGDKAEAVAVAADVGRFEVVERSDLQVVRVAADPDLEVMPASRLEQIVGRVAAVDLVAGSLLAPDQLLAQGERVVTSTEALVGARLKPTELPPDGVRAGAPVQVVLRPAPAAGSGGSVSEFSGWLMSVGQPDATTGERSVSLVVPRPVAPDVTAAAADGRVSVVVLEG